MVPATDVCVGGPSYISCQNRLFKIKYGFKGSVSNFGVLAKQAIDVVLVILKVLQYTVHEFLSS